ncbi:pyridoxal phosphate-dependent aminotransferase [Priestia megaterium]|uniref:DegT/DnrJ/EryC1/StrS family aminotransferase n=1 Tax=Priestia megaterium TaxID=1404 RepID=UPI000BF87329|nr:pyridoxal phosphate-dependent aminotransferase [Priestia megaterium]PMD11920.1 pyridoxal phosphate-dependent aminotransferase [Priestia megaterium]
MSGEEIKYVNQAFETNWIAPLGPNVDEFEKNLANYVGTKGATAVSSGTAAIHLALQLLEVGKLDTVFCSTFTFIASANPILYQGAVPVFIDSEPETWNMSPSALKCAFLEAEKEGKMPKAVIVVNLYGQSAKMDEIVEICKFYNVPIIEDAAESLGSFYKGKPSGTFGEFGVYSFNGNKIITTSGGGMLVSNDEKALNEAKFLATQARDQAPYYQHSRVGYNYRMSNVLAGIGIAQLQVLEERVQARREVYKRYVESFKHIKGIEFMPELEGTFSNRWLTTFLIKKELLDIKPLELVEKLAEENIEARPLWKPLHLQPLFGKMKFYKHNNISIAEELFETGICLPSGSNMSEVDQQRVIDAINKIIY